MRQRERVMGNFLGPKSAMAAGFCFFLFTLMLFVWWFPLGFLGVWWKYWLSVPAFLVAVVVAIAAIAKFDEDGGVALLVYASCGFLFLCTAFVLWRFSPSFSPKSAEPQELAASEQLTAKVQIWCERLDNIVNAGKKFQEDKQYLVSRMKAMGFQSSQDIRRSRTHQQIAEELLELQTQIKRLESQKSDYELAIVQMGSALRRLDRKQLLSEVDISSKEYGSLMQTALELEERLQKDSDQSTAVKIELDMLLKETFGKDVGK